MTVMHFDEYRSLDGLALGELVRKGEITSLELLDCAIARAEEVNPAINAIVYRFYDMARDAARGRQSETGPFAGVPFLLKDILGDCQGVPTRFGSRYVPETGAEVDSELVARFKRAGFVPFAKTNVPEFGLPPVTEPVLYGPARNPWNLARTPGGSSGGAAAAVASGIVPVAHANDGGGSIRIPAACCGLVGLKPTRARNSLAPHLGDAMNGLVVEHVISRTVRDSAAALDATAGPAPGDPYTAPAPVRPYLQEVATVPQPLRIAFATQNPFGGLVDPDCIRAVHETAKLCADLGHQVEESAPTLNIAPVSFAFITVFAAGLAAAIEGVKLLTGREPTRDTLESMTWNFYRMGLELSASQYLLAVTTLQRASREFAVFFEKYDVWLTPALGTPPLRVGTFDFTSPAANLADERVLNFVLVNPLYNMTGQPAVSLPAFWNGDGLPIGVLFGARFGDEATLFRLAGQLEQARPWASRKPPLKD